MALYWLARPSTASAAVAALAAPTVSPRPAHRDRLQRGRRRFDAMFGDPTRDPHTPDLVVSLKKGTIYSLSKKKDAEHGGFADDDAHVALLVSNPGCVAPSTTRPCAPSRSRPPSSTRSTSTRAGSTRSARRAPSPSPASTSSVHLGLDIKNLDIKI